MDALAQYDKRNPVAADSYRGEPAAVGTEKQAKKARDLSSVERHLLTLIYR